MWKQRLISTVLSKKIRSLGVKPSVVINPGTPVEAIKHVLHLVDQVLVMTVNPGFGGQAFLPETMDKVRELVALREEKGLNFEIEVDGGIDDQTIAQAKEAGATVFVAGSYVFREMSMSEYNSQKTTGLGLLFLQAETADIIGRILMLLSVWIEVRSGF